MSDLSQRRTRGGVVSVTASKVFPTGLNKLHFASAILSGSATPGVKGAVVTAAINKNADGNIGLYVWMPTSNSNPTLIPNDQAVNVIWSATEESP